MAESMLKINLRLTWILILLLSACNQSDKSPPEVKLNLDQETVNYNGTVNISWKATAVDYCIASGDWNGNIKASGSKTPGPLTHDSFFILNCYHAGEEISDSVLVKVTPPKIPEVKLHASPLSIGFRDSTTITWSSKHIKDCMAAGDWSGKKEPNGSLKIDKLETNSEFSLICNGPEGKISKTVSINVAEDGIKVPRVNLTATPSTVSYNGSTMLSWNTVDADICKATGDWFGSKARSGTQTINQLNTNRHYILSCIIAGGGGGEGVDTAEVSVRPAPLPVVTLTATPTELAPNSNTTLQWSSSHARSCIAMGDWSGTKSTSGTLTISGLTKDSKFSLKCTGISGLGTDTVTVTLIKDNR